MCCVGVVGGWGGGGGRGGGVGGGGGGGGESKRESERERGKVIKKKQRVGKVCVYVCVGGFLCVYLGWHRSE